MSMAVATTPKVITAEIQQFCSQIENATPEFLAVTPRSFARKLVCHINVQREINREGGKTQLGWLIWEFPEAYLKAEQHIVVSRSGSFINVTPQFNDESTILFLPSSTKFTGQFAPDRYMQLSDHTLVTRMMKLMIEREALGPFGQSVDKLALQLQQEYMAILQARAGGAGCHAPDSA